MGILFNKRKDFFIRFPLALLLIFIFAISPLLISAVGAELTSMWTGEPCHEGNCFWGAFFWLFIYSFMLAALMLLILLAVLVIDLISYRKSM